MVRMTFVALLVLAAVCASVADLPKPIPLPKPLPKDCCGKNEIWKECGNSCLEPKCDRSHKHVACPAVCMARCECIDGTLRNKQGKCVEPCDC